MSEEKDLKDFSEIALKEKRERLKEATKRISEEMSSVCLESYNLSGLTLVKGDVIEVLMKGRTVKDILTVEFECVNPVFSWMKVNTSDYELIIKLRDIKLIRRKKRGVK